MRRLVAAGGEHEGESAARRARRSVRLLLAGWLAQDPAQLAGLGPGVGLGGPQLGVVEAEPWRCPYRALGAHSGAAGGSDVRGDLGGGNGHRLALHGVQRRKEGVQQDGRERR
jgi:hypothetical protein